MKKCNYWSTVEIWTKDCINFPDKRQSKDRDKVIVQCEPGSPMTEDYIVEVIDRDKLPQ